MTGEDHRKSERQTRKRRIDGQLGSLGWVVLSVDDARGRGAEAVCEYETENGPADYAMTVNGTVLGVVEAKRISLGPQNALTQAERYARGVTGSQFNFDDRCAYTSRIADSSVTVLALTTAGSGLSR